MLNGLLDGIRAVIFDAGNTLALPDSRTIVDIATRAVHQDFDEAAVASTIQDVLAEADGDPEFLRQLAERSVPANWHWRRVFARLGLDEERVETIGSAVDAAHRERHLWSDLNPDALPVLQELRRRGMQVAVISNSEDGRVEELLNDLGLVPHLDLWVDSFVVGLTKPDPRVFLHTTGKLGVAPSAAVYVGDAYTQDVVGAQRAGLKAILLDPLDRHVQRDAVRIRSLRELIERP